MALPVFSPAAAKRESESRYQDDLKRAERLAALTDELLKEKAEVERLAAEAQKERQEEAERWFAEQTIKRNSFLKEIETLEERRKLALQPPLIKAEDIHTVEEALHARKLDLDYRQDQVESDARALMVRIDELSTKETDFKQRERRLKLKEQGAETQRQEVVKNVKRLNEGMERFATYQQEKESDFAFKQSELDAREHLLNEREASFVSREKEIEAAHRVLDDRRRLLDSGFDELTRLKKQHGRRN